MLHEVSRTVQQEQSIHVKLTRSQLRVVPKSQVSGSICLHAKVLGHSSLQFHYYLPSSQFTMNFFTLPLHFAGANSTSKPTSDERSDRQQNKRVRIDEEAVASMTSQIIHFARQTLQAISELFIDLPNDGSTTVFGQKSDGLPGRKYVFKAGFQTDPWIRGVVPCPPQAYVSEQLEVFFATAPATELSR